MRISKLHRMYILSFLFTLHIAISAYVNSTFLSNVVGERYVGLLYTTASILTLFLLTKSSVFLKNFGNRNLSIILLSINIIGLIGLIGSTNPGLIALSFISILSTNALISLCLDVFIEHFGNPTTIGRTRGLYLTITNLGWMVSPLLTGLLVTTNGGYRMIYIIALLVTLVMAIGLFFSVKRFSDKTYARIPFLQAYEYLKKNPHMLSITIINFILQFFFVLMVIYTPIYLIKHIGFVWSQIGVIFTIMLVPFVVFGLPIGVLIDKYGVSKRTLLRGGFIIMTLATASIAFISTKNIAVWAIVLFLTRTGASLVETTSEIYFFTHVKEEDAYLLGIFRDMNPVAFIVAPLFATVTFLFVPFHYLFIILAVVLLCGFYYVNRLKHSHEYTLPNSNQ